MKDFYTVLFLFLIMTGAILINCRYINTLSEDFIDHLDRISVSEDAEPTISETRQLQQKWDAQRNFVKITANHTEIEAIDNFADELCVFAEGGDWVEFEKARRLLVNAFEELATSESLFSSYYNKNSSSDSRSMTGHPVSSNRLRD